MGRPSTPLRMTSHSVLQRGHFISGFPALPGSLLKCLQADGVFERAIHSQQPALTTTMLAKLQDITRQQRDNDWPRFLKEDAVFGAGAATDRFI
jgi:hypothetical protein